MRVEDLLAAARAELDRLGPAEAAAVQADGGLLVDIRYAAQRERDGTVPGALVVERNELEWRLDPACAHRSARATHHALPVVVFCDEGYASSLAAVSLRRLGLRHATDLVGGFQAWRAAGLPVDAPTQAAVDTTAQAVPTDQSSGRKAPRISGSSPSSASACRTTRRASPSE